MVFGTICCFVCFKFLGSAFMEKGECRHSIPLDLKGELAHLSVLVFFFMKTSGNLVPIGALNFGRMRSHGHKERSFL
jgi:hypothetical protein